MLSSSEFLKNPSGKSLSILLAGLLIFLTVIFGSNLGQLPGRITSILAPLFATAAIVAALGYAVVPILRKLKTGQAIREDGPQAHLQKAGTPTMGGIFFIPIAIVVALAWTRFSAEAIVLSSVAFAYGAIGWIDDWEIIRRKSNKGISPRMKLTLQIIVAILFCLWLALTRPDSITNVSLPFGMVLPLGMLFWLLAGFALVAESNATNLTDGIDGLAAGTAAIASLGLAIIAAPVSLNLTIFSACLSGSCLGFIVHNRNPATVFMGDTGSLALGGALAAVGLMSQNLWGLLLLSGIFLVESLSVIAQVIYYKATKGSDGKGKRLFKMAPIHHHLELSGWSETQIVGVFYAINGLLAIFAFFLA